MNAPPHHRQEPNGSLRARYLAAQEFESMLGSAQKNVELWAALWRYARVDDDYVRRASSLSGSLPILIPIPGCNVCDIDHNLEIVTRTVTTRMVCDIDLFSFSLESGAQER